MSLLRRVYRQALRIYPDSIRGLYGREMEDLAADGWRAARRGRTADRLEFLVRTTRDLIVNGLGARWEGVRGMGRGLQEFRYTLRGLLRRPGFTLVAVATLALGIGGNTAIFSMVDAAFFDPLPYPDDDHLVVPYNVPTPDRGGGFAAFSAPLFTAIRDEGVFTDVAEIAPQQVNIGGSERPERVTAARVNAGFFDVAGVAPVVGRGFTDAEAVPGGPDVAVLSHGLWERRFALDPAVVGRAVVLNDRATRVVGVMPPDFELIFDQVDLWIPTRVDEGAFTLTTAQNNNRILVARLADGQSLAAATARLPTAIESVRARFPGALSESHEIRLVPLREHLYGNARSNLTLLLGAVGLVLLVACANLANLLLVRGETRQNELGIRAALGASRGRLLRVLLMESLVLAGLGALMGIGLALALLRIAAPLAPPSLPLPAAGLDGSVLVFTCVITLATGLLFGLAPAWQGTRRSLRSSLVSGTRGSVSSRGRWSVGGGLIVFEVALTAVLLVGSGLLLGSLYRIHSVDPGFETADRTVAPLALSAGAYPDVQRLNAFYIELLERLEAHSDVEAAGLGQFIPLNGASNWGFEVDGQPDRGLGFADYTLITPGYLEAMGQRIVRGRSLTWDDAREGAPPVLLVSEAMAAELWPDADPIGERINIDTETQVWRQVVGVVSDVRNRSLTREPGPILYFPPVELPMSTPRGMSVFVHHAGVAPPVAALRGIVEAMDPTVPVSRVGTLDDIAAQSEGRRRFVMMLMGLFAGTALLLAAVGLYGVVSYSFSRRRREIGLRMAVGAPRSSVLAMVLGHGGRLVGAGLAVGLGVSAFATRLLDSLLFETGPVDPWIYLGVAVFLGGVAAAATWIPAMRAARVDPASALRDA